MSSPKVKTPFSFRVKGSRLTRIVLVWLLAQLISMDSLNCLAKDENPLQENPPSNEEFLRESTRSLLRRAFVDFPKTTSKLLFLKAEKEHPANWLLEGELIRHLRSLNYQVALHSEKLPDNWEESWSLFYRIIKMRMDYPRIKRKGFLGERMVVRYAGLNLSFRLEDNATGKVLWTRREKQSNSDLIKMKMIKSLNNQSYPFLSPSLPEDSYGRFIEPALVIAVVGGLVYLFFANR